MFFRDDFVIPVADLGDRHGISPGTFNASGSASSNVSRVEQAVDFEDERNELACEFDLTEHTAQ